MPDFLTVGQLAERYNADPLRISRTIYANGILRRVCPLTSGRRYIPEKQLDCVLLELRRAGVIAREPVKGGADA